MLWLLLLVVPLAALHFSRVMGGDPKKKFILAAVRILAALLLLLALARPVIERDDPTYTVVSVEDTSPSMGASLTASEQGEEGIQRIQADDSALGDALALANALIPFDGRGEVRLITDGLESRGGALFEARRLARRGIPVLVEAAGERRTRDVILRSLDLPASQGMGATIELSCEVESSRAGRVVLSVEHDQDLLASQGFFLEAGVQRIACPLPLKKEGLNIFSVRAESEFDRIENNNVLTAAIFVTPPQIVGVVETAAETPAAKALDALLGEGSRVRSLKPSDPFDELELLVIADTPASAFIGDAMERIKTGVEDGMGLLMTGGRRSFGPGGYGGTPVAEVLPVRFPQTMEHCDPSTTLVVIIDTSGSMGGPRVNLAKEIARLALAHLKPHDKAGIVEFYGSKRWAAPIQPASNAIDLTRALNRLTPGGGTVILPAIEEAFYALKNVRTRTKHVIVLTDGGVESGAFEPLIRKMAREGITLSFVLVGPSAHSAFLIRLALWGRGRFYAAPDRFNLPEIIIKQPTISPLSPITEGPARMKHEGDRQFSNLILKGVDLEKAPELGGFVKTEARPHADLLLAADSGHPLLVAWQHGLGRAGAFTSQLGGEWSKDAQLWKPFGKIFSNLVRFLSAPGAAETLRIRIENGPGAVTIHFDARKPGRGGGFDELHVSMTGPGSFERRWTLDPVESRAWNLGLENLPEGAYCVEARNGDGNLEGTGAFAIPPPREFKALGPDLELLDAIRALRAEAETQAALLSSKPARSPEEIWPYLAAVGLVLFLLHVAIRRFPGRASSAALLAPFFLMLPIAEGQDSAEEALHSARTKRESGAFQEARAILAEASLEWPEDAGLLAELARMEELLGNDAASLAALDGAINLEGDPSRVFALKVRSALLLYDRGDQEAAGRLLATLPSPRFCAYLASLNEDFDTALALLTPSGAGWPLCRDHLFRGCFLMKRKEWKRAQEEFELALEKAEKKRDQEYALERILASAREAGRLSKLADRWLADSGISLLRLPFLVSILRELNRAEDALKLLDKPGISLDGRVVVSLAMEAGRTKEAEAAYESLIERHPDKAEYPLGLARLELLLGRRDQAVDAVLDAMGRISDTGELMALADGARRLSLDECAVQAARKADQGGVGVFASIFEADLKRERGDADKAAALLEDLEGRRSLEADRLLLVAEAYERFGFDGEALRVLQGVYEETRSEDVLLRVAWLLEESGRFEEALDVWKDLWRSTEVPARLKQAQERLLDLAARIGRLADLVVELEEGLDGAGNEKGERFLSLLVDLYTGVQDTVSASEILHEYGAGCMGEIESLKRLARVYMNCEQFGRSSDVLRRLAELDPENGPEYWQQIAIVALERGHVREAKDALSRLAPHAGELPWIEEFSAGVLDMIGLHEDAAAAYDRLLAESPDRIEAYLLWGKAMKAAGKGERAAARFQNLAEEAREDDLFAVAVDGLLNLEAPPKALRSALRRVYARIAADPDKMFLYRLAADLLEALGRDRRMNHVLEEAVVVAKEQRAPLLRELMDAAAADGRWERVIRLGRSLLALGTELPPSVYIGLGEAMIRQEQFALAERVFDRAGEGAEFTDIRRRVAESYEAADRPEQADRIIRDLLILEPDSVSLLIRSGNLCEQQGDFYGAHHQYLRATDLMLRRLPGRMTEVDAPPSVGRNGERPRTPRRAANLDEVGQYFESAAQGLLNTARTDILRRRLLDEAARWVEEEMEELVDREILSNFLDENPRLERMTAFAREIMFCLHDPNKADEMDLKLCLLYPEDDALARGMVNERIEWGFYARAGRLSDEVLEEEPLPLRAARLIRDSEERAALLGGGKVDADLGVRLTALLVMTGREDEARLAILSTDPGSSEAIRDLASTMIAASAMLDFDEGVDRWISHWLEGCRRSRDAEEAASSLEHLIRQAWNLLDARGRRSLSSRIDGLAAAWTKEQRLPLDTLRFRLAQSLGEPFEDLDLLLEIALSSNLDADQAARLLEAMPSSERLGWLQRLVRAREPEGRREFLLQAAASPALPEDRNLRETMVSLFETSPKGKQDPERIYYELQRHEWFANPNQRELGTSIGKVLLEESPAMPGVQITAALAFENGGLHDEALALAREVLKAEAAIREPDFKDVRILGNVVSVMTREERVNAIDMLAREEGSVTPMTSYIRGSILESLGRYPEAAEAYRAAYKASPSNRVLSRNIISFMKKRGRLRELAELLSDHLLKSTIMESFEWRTLAATFRELYNPLAAVRAAQKDTGPLGPLEVMYVNRMMGRHEEILRSMRRFLIKNRNKGRFYSPTWRRTDPLKGMAGYFSEAKRSGALNRITFSQELAGLPFAGDEFFAYLQAASPNRRDVPGLIGALVKAAASIEGLQAKFASSLMRLKERGALTIKDRRLLPSVVAGQDAARLRDLRAALDELLIHTEGGGSLREDEGRRMELAGLYKTLKAEKRARSILEWQIALDGRKEYPTRSADSWFDRFREYLALCPLDEREREHRRWLLQWDPSPLEGLNDNLDALRLKGWIDHGDDREVESRLAKLEGKLKEDTSGKPFRALRTVMAQQYARTERIEKFSGTVEELLIDSARAGKVTVHLDCRELLPRAEDLRKPGRWVERVVSLIDNALDEGLIFSEDAVPALCLAGYWCVESGLTEMAARIAADAEERAGNPGPHWLWIADLEYMAGLESRGMEIETSLLENDMLPVPRVPDLLERVGSMEGKAAAVKLARRVALYSDHPDVLRLLIRCAREKGDQEGAKIYIERLRAVSPR